MRIHAALVVFVLFFAFGCASVQHRSDTAGLPPATARALERLRPGMKDQAVIAIMRPVSLDWGRYHLGGSGESILYFQLTADLQLVVSVSGFAGGFRSGSAGTVCPKEEWIRMDDDRIWVPDRSISLTPEQMEEVMKTIDSK